MYPGVQNIEQRQYVSTLHRNQTLPQVKAIQTGRKVVDVGILTIEVVITAKGEETYAATARPMKRGRAKDLKKIITSCIKELERIGERKPVGTAEYFRNYRAANREEYNAKNRKRHAANLEAINERRRQKYAEKQQLKATLANMDADAGHKGY